MTDALLGTSVPVFTVDGERRGELGRDCARLEIEETTAGLRTLVARFVARGPEDDATEEHDLYLDGAIFDFGRPIEVAIGAAGDTRTLFSGRISAIEVDYAEGREPYVVVSAEDRFMDLRMTRRDRTYEQVSDADIAEAIAGLHGLSASVDAEGPTYDVVQQWNQSDLAFLRERARRIQADVWIDGRTLCFAARDRRQAPEVTLVLGNDLLSLNVSADLAHQRTAVRVTGYDAQSRSAIDEEATDSVVRAETSGGRTGPGVLEQALGERVSHRTRDVPLTDGEARAFATAEMLRRARRFVVAQGLTSGTPDLIVGSRVRLDRVAPPFAGPAYYVCAVCHTFDLEQGHRTRFEAERATVSEGR